MSKLLNDGFNWLRRSISEHENVRETKSAPVTNQSSLDHDDDNNFEEDNDENDFVHVSSAASAAARPPGRPRPSSTRSRTAKTRTTSACVTMAPPPGPGHSSHSDDPPPAATPVLSLSDPQPPPELIGETTILTDEATLLELESHLPPIKVASPWTLVFTSESDGFSLSRIFRKMKEKAKDGGHTLLAIRDTHGDTFGAFLDDVLRFDERGWHYGRSGCFLFRLTPEFAVYKASGKNAFYVRCDTNDGVSFGSDGEGRFGLHLSSLMSKCRSQRCETYDNEPLSVGHPDGDFAVKTIEVWII